MRYEGVIHLKKDRKRRRREERGLESRRFEVLNLSLEEREVGVSHAKGLKKKKKRLVFKESRVGFGLNGGQQH